jgi:hypothetical protein
MKLYEKIIISTIKVFLMPVFFVVAFTLQIFTTLISEPIEDCIKFWRGGYKNDK